MTDWIMWVGCKLEVICTPFLWFVLSLSPWTHYCYLSLFFFLSLQSKTGALEGPEVDGLIKDMMGLVRVRRYAAVFWHLHITVFAVYRITASVHVLGILRHFHIRVVALNCHQVLADTSNCYLICTLQISLPFHQASSKHLLHSHSCVSWW